jgi:VanZ family protein
MHTRLLRMALIAALGVIFILALMPVPAGLHAFQWQDKLEHAGVFLLLGLMAAAARAGTPRMQVAGLLAYGALIELAQAGVPHRSADPADWLADAVGVALAALVLRLRRKVGAPAR